MTRDADLTLLTGFGGEEQFIHALLQQFPGRRDDALEFALQYRVLLLEDQNGTPFDIALGALPFEYSAIERASSWEINKGRQLITVSAEDLIIQKAFANRPQDWLDVEGIIARQFNKLNWTIVDETLPGLLELKGAPEIMENLARMRESM